MKTPVGRAKKREALLRWRQSPENRAKMAERARLYKQNPMVRAKHAESMRRFRQTPDGRAKSVEIVRRWLQNPENRAKKLEYDRMRRQRPEVRASRAEYTRRRLKTDLKFRLATSLRSRLQKALKGTVKSARTLELLGCSVEHLIKHLESNFRPGMSWANRTEWHIDHIRPLASFDLTDPAQQRAACHWTNLQPLWADDNFRKHAKYETPSHPEGDTGKEVGANRTIAEPHSPGFFQNI